MKWKMYWAVVISLFLSLLVWKNWKFFPQKTVRWRIGKTIADFCLLTAMAIFFPVMLVVQGVYFLTTPIERKGIRLTVAALSGVLFSKLSLVALEILMVVGAFAIDRIIIDWWDKFVELGGRD